MFQILWPSLVTLALVALAGCASTQSPAESAPSTPSATAETEAEPPASAPERPALTAEDCAAQGGTVVGDIGDGAIHRPDYRCPSGAAPSGTITSSGAGPVAIEGSVCCPG